jgi:hypothetical protein
MKSLIYSILLFFVASLYTSCDKIENPYPPAIELDTTLFPGNWDEYLTDYYPNFEAINTQQQHVLLEDYTGHLCNNCPAAAEIAHGIEADHPNRVFVASIHAAPGGISSFQVANPEDDKFFTDHTNPDAIAYGEAFQTGFNFFGNPQGTVNRKVVEGKMFDFSGSWQTRVSNLLGIQDAPVYLQSTFNYFEATNGGFLHVEVTKNTSEALNLNTVVYVIQDTLVDWQLMQDNSYNPNYVHYDKHLGSIDGRPWGISVFSVDDPVGAKKILDYSYEIPSITDLDNMHFLIYVYDTDSFEVLQVIQQRL